jgi:hypothetical protein
MAIDTRVPRSRRAVLAAGLGGLGASVLHALGRPAPAAAATGDPITAGQQTTATLRTTLVQQNSLEPGLEVYGGANFARPAIVGSSDMSVGVEARGMTGLIGVSGGDAVAPVAKIGVYGYANQDANARAVYGKSLLGTGVWGNSDTGRGLFGRSTAGTGVSAQSDTGRAMYGTTGAPDKTAILGQNTNGGGSGVQGMAGTGVPPAPEAQTGVFGSASISELSNGVTGRSVAGTGVWGDTNTGVGVVATGQQVDSWGLYAAGGIAMVVQGPAFFSESGKTTITSGSSATVTVPSGIGPDSVGFATLMTNRAGIWVRAVTTNETNGTITIYLNTNVPGSTTVGWYVIN